MLATQALAATPADRADCAGKVDKEPDVALAACSRVIDDASEAAFERARAYKIAAALRSTTKDYDRAIADYSEAIKIDPHDAPAYARRGMAWTEKGEFDSATADLTEAIKIDPNDGFGFAQRGLTQFKKRLITKKGGWEPAISDYSEAIRLDPNAVGLYGSRGVAYSNNRQYDLAVPDCKEVIRREPNNWGGYNCRGVAYEGMKNYDRALADYDRSIRLDPKNGAVFWNRGNVYKDLGEFNRAIADYNLAIAINSEGLQRVQFAWADLRRDRRPCPRAGGFHPGDHVGAVVCRGLRQPRPVLAACWAGATRRSPTSAKPSRSTPTTPLAGSSCAASAEEGDWSSEYYDTSCPREQAIKSATSAACAALLVTASATGPARPAE